jgi:5-methylthioadenosine/S-adenosylhomocysteine deaminase
MAHFRAETRSQERLLVRSQLTMSPARVVLRGRIVTMNGAGDVIPDGMICIEGDRISQVDPWPATLPPRFETAPVVNTNGTIYPGLIELHNHPAYNVVPMWDVPKHYDSRAQWRADANYKRRVANTATLLSYHPKDVYPKALVRCVECRAALGGVTTTQGFSYKNGTPLTSYFEGLTRNVEFPNKTWPTASDYINDFSSKQDAEKQLTPILGKREPFIIHLTEGIDIGTRGLFYNMQQADGSWLIGPELITIHNTALTNAEFQILAQHQSSGVVWSPLSNFLLYGDTTKIDLVKAVGLPIAIGCDWAPSGTKNLLGELKVAKHVSSQAGGIFSDRELVAAVTSTPARMLGWGSYLGTIEVNKTADLLILDSVQADPYANLISADESKVIAVIIDGRPRAGRADVIDPRTPGVELITIAEQNLVLDIVESAQHPLAGVSLASAIATTADALAHLPDVAREAKALAPLMQGSLDHWRPILDYDVFAPGADLFIAAALPGPSDVDAMTMEPLTAVDDAGFIPRIKNNVNVPQWLKNVL